MILEKILKIKQFLAVFPIQKLFRTPEPYQQILKRTTQGTFLQKSIPQGAIVSVRCLKKS
jgi:hypothetical protein